MFFSNLEEAFHVVLGSAVPHAGVRILAHHVINGMHDVCHLLTKTSHHHKLLVKHEKKKKKKLLVKSADTSRVMQPSLLRSYRLKAQLSLSVTEPLRMMDRLKTKSYGPVKTTKKNKWDRKERSEGCISDTHEPEMDICFSSPASSHAS